MEQLSAQDEQAIFRFNQQMQHVYGPADMFPPDEAGDLERLSSPNPFLPTAEAICFRGLARANFELGMVV